MAEKVVKIVETQEVTSEKLEELINEQIAQGWVLDGIHFAMSESSRRPAMAFLLFFEPGYAKKMQLKPIPKEK